MEFRWGRSLYFASRAAVIGAVAGFLLSIVIAVAAGRANGGGTAVIGMFWLFGLVRLAWDLFGQKYPDA